MNDDWYLRQIAEVRREIAKLKRGRVTFRWATVTATDPEAGTFDADVDGAEGSLTGLSVDREQLAPDVGDRVLLTVDGATPRYDRPSRVYPAVIDPVTGDTLAAIGDDGSMSGQVGNFESLLVGGQEWVPTTSEDQTRPLGVVEYGAQYVNSTGTSTELGVFEVGADLEVDRLYLIETSCLAFAGPTGALAQARIRMSDDGTTPTLTDTVIATVGGAVSAGDDDGRTLRRVHTPSVTGRHRFLLTVVRTGGAAGNVGLTGSTTFPIQMWVADLGPYRGNNGVANDGGGGAVTTKQTITKRYPAVWSGSYNGSALQTFAGNEMRQGPYGGDWRGMVGFNSSDIVSDLTGATVESCIVYLYASHWYFNSGGTAIIGTHTNSSRPGTWSGVTEDRWRSSGWPKPGARRVNLGVSVGNEFQAGTTKGIALGPAPTSSKTYYGRFNGDGMTKEPYLEIRYVK